MAIKVKDRPDLLRDEKSGAIVNTNSDIVIAARLRKRKKEKNNKEIKKLREEVNALKSLVAQLINKNNETIL